MPQAVEKKHGQPALIDTLRSRARLLMTLAGELFALASMAAALGTGFILLSSALSNIA